MLHQKWNIASKCIKGSDEKEYTKKYFFPKTEKSMLISTLLGWKEFKRYKANINDEFLRLPVRC